MIEIKSKFGVLKLPNDNEYISEIVDMIENSKVASMNLFLQHGTKTCFEHCVEVSYRSYVFCKKRGLNARSAARAGLVHDMFLYDWHRPNSSQEHGLSHAFFHSIRAYKNAKLEFNLNDIEKDIILKHMWPLTLKFPRYKETYVILYIDKLVTLKEVGSNVKGKIASFGFRKAI